MDTAGATTTDTSTLLRQHAARLFAERGYDAVSVREIVEAAGVTKPALYYHFGNKEGLARAVLNEMVEAALEVRDRAFTEGKTPKQAFVIHGAGMLDLAKRFRHTIAFGHSLHFGRGSLKELVAFTQEVHESFTRAWEKLLTGMGMTKQTASRATKAFWALLKHELMNVASQPDWRGDPHKTATEFADIVLYGVLGEPDEN